MKTIGLLGGLSYESTLEYYRIINEAVQERLGGVHSAALVMHSFDFQAIEVLQHAGQWDQLAEQLGQAGAHLRAAGADFLVICSNTMHKVADEVARQSGLFVLHIADATGNAIRERDITRVGLLGTAFTMEEPFMTGHLRQRFGLDVLVPPAPDRRDVHRIIYEELVIGRIEEASRRRYQVIIEGLLARGAEGIILGCTEIGLLVRPQDVPVPVFDTTPLHALAAVAEACGRDDPKPPAHCPNRAANAGKRGPPPRPHPQA